MMISEKPSRHDAMTSADESDRRTSGAASEMPRTDTTSTSNGDVAGARFTGAELNGVVSDTRQKVTARHTETSSYLPSP